MLSKTKLTLYTCRRYILFSLMLFSAGACAGDAHQIDNRATVAVQGRGSIDVVPDEVAFSVTLEARAGTVGESYQLVERRTAKALALLREQGIPAQRLQAMQLSIHPVYDYKQGQRLIGHDARRNINITLDDFQQYARALDSLASIEKIRFNQARLQSSEYNTLQIDALEAAFVDARKKADVLAVASGRTLGPVIQINEQGASHYQPRVQMDMMRSSAQGEASIAPGTMEIQGSVTAVFTLQ